MQFILKVLKFYRLDFVVCFFDAFLIKVSALGEYEIHDNHSVQKGNISIMNFLVCYLRNNKPSNYQQ